MRFIGRLDAHSSFPSFSLVFLRTTIESAENVTTLLKRAGDTASLAPFCSFLVQDDLQCVSLAFHVSSGCKNHLGGACFPGSFGCITSKAPSHKTVLLAIFIS